MSHQVSCETHRHTCRHRPARVRSSTFPKTKCRSLFKEFPNHVTFPNDPEYARQSSQYWALDRAQARPQCRVAPTTSTVLAGILRSLSMTDAPFTVKSGGHSSVTNASNVEGLGITIDLRHLDDIVLAEDRRSVEVGSGARWRDVYEVLDAENLTVAGARAGSVGVGGYLLGGGVSFISGTHGWACDTVLTYEVVLANSSIITASATENNDLFRALKGGGSNFGIVTKFRLETFESHGLDTAIIVYPWQQLWTVTHALAEFNRLADSDPAAAVSVSIGIHGKTQEPSLVALMTHPDTVLQSAPLRPFLTIARKHGWRGRTNSSELAEHYDRSDPAGFRHHKITLTISNNAYLAHLFATIFKNRILSANFSTNDSSSFRGAMLLQPLTLPHLRAGLRSGNNSLGLHNEKEPLILISADLRTSPSPPPYPSPSRSAPTDAPTPTTASPSSLLIPSLMHSFISSAFVHHALHPFRYLNYASGDQDVFASVRRPDIDDLKAVQNRYDPDRFWARRLTGPHKLSDRVAWFMDPDGLMAWDWVYPEDEEEV